MCLFILCALLLHFMFIDFATPTRPPPPTNTHTWNNNTNNNSISGLSPFMGENDIETMSNVTIAKYDFEDECFNGISPECLDFIAKLLVKDLRCVFLISL